MFILKQLNLAKNVILFRAWMGIVSKNYVVNFSKSCCYFIKVGTAMAFIIELIMEYIGIIHFNNLKCTFNVCI